MRFRLSSALSGAAIVILLLGIGAWAARAPASAAAQDRSGARLFMVRGHKYAFEPAQLEVLQDDVVTISFLAEDIPHSFTIDEYRISKRAAAGQRVSFEFRADRPGSFRFYCDLRLDEGCRNMHGQLIVRAR
jgi:heme/copper-type cytochrome/quinol oxidase subunit 2